MKPNKPFQRKGAISNSHVGRDFEQAAKNFFSDLLLKENLKISIGISSIKKEHAFDLGNLQKKIIVECKSNTWTQSDRMPSAKLTAWDQAMYYFSIAPSEYRKIMFVLRNYSKKRKESLTEYYLRTHAHLIPRDVEIWEYDLKNKDASKLL